MHAARRREGPKPAPSGRSEALESNRAAWMRAFAAMSGLAGALLETDAMQALRERIAEADAEYRPGAPASPVLELVFASWWMGDLPVGSMREPLCSILADLGPAMGLDDELIRCARLFARSRLGVYRVTAGARDRVELDERVSGARVWARPPPDLQPAAVNGELWLTRLLPPLAAASRDWIVWTAPYRLDGADPDADWAAYCARIAASVVPSRTEPAAWVARHFKGTDQPQRWLEYIMAGYAGTDEHGAIVLTGVPDRPASLPHGAGVSRLRRRR